MAHADPVLIEVLGLRVDARIGVSEEERSTERPLEIDVRVRPGHGGATSSDDIADTVDYAALAGIAAEVVRAQPHRTLERLAAAIAEAIETRSGEGAVEVRVAKPAPPMPEQVHEAAVVVGSTELPRP